MGAGKVINDTLSYMSTSARYYESTIFSCLFGCPHGRDELAHYVMCPCLFNLIQTLRSSTPSCPVKRLGLASPATDTLLSVACTLSGYHAIKRSHFTSSLTQYPLNIQQRNAARKLCADAFFVAALEVGLDCRSGIQFPDLSSTSDIGTASNFSSAHADACG